MGLVTCGVSHLRDISIRQALSFVEGTPQLYPIVSFRTLQGQQLPSVAFLGVLLSRSHCGQYDEGAFSNILIDVKMVKLHLSNFLIDRSCHHHSMIELTCGTLET